MRFNGFRRSCATTPRKISTRLRNQLRAVFSPARRRRSAVRCSAVAAACASSSVKSLIGSADSSRFLEMQSKGADCLPGVHQWSSEVSLHVGQLLETLNHCRGFLRNFSCRFDGDHLPSAERLNHGVRRHGSASLSEPPARDSSHACRESHRPPPIRVRHETLRGTTASPLVRTTVATSSTEFASESAVVTSTNLVARAAVRVHRVRVARGRRRGNQRACAHAAALPSR